MNNEKNCWTKCENGWLMTRKDGTTIALTSDEASNLRDALRRDDAWDEVDCRIESGCYEGYEDAIEEAREGIIDAILEETEVEIDGDVVYDAISQFVDFGDDEEDDEDDEEMDVCPVCGAEIDPSDGEEDGYGKLRLYWKCKSCGSTGTAIIDQHNDNAFVAHEVD